MTKAITLLADLRPDPKNANRGTPRGHGIIEHSIRQHGAGRSGLAASDGTMLAGNQTLQKMAELGIPIKPVHTTGDEWVVVIRDDLDPESEEARLLALEDNRSTEVGYDPDPGILAELAQDYDLSHLYSSEELAALLVDTQQVEPEEDTPVAIDEDKPTRVQPGDIWRVGEHIVACLDSTEPSNLDRVLAARTDRAVHFVWADPPYGISAVDTNKGTLNSGNPYPFGGLKGSVGSGNLIPANRYSPIVGDDTTNTARSASSLLLSAYPTATHFWWGANHYADALPPSSCWVVWDKREDVPGNDFADGELAWSNRKLAIRIFRHLWSGLLKASERSERRVHPTQKPIALCRWAFEKYGSAGDTILDPFLGSGPSLKAAHEMNDGRVVVGFGLSPAYCDHVIEWAEAHGLVCERIDG